MRKMHRKVKHWNGKIHVDSGKNAGYTLCGLQWGHVKEIQRSYGVPRQTRYWLLDGWRYERNGIETTCKWCIKIEANQLRGIR